VERGQPDGPLIGAWEVARRSGNGGEGGGGQNSGVERARAQGVGNGEGAGMSAVRRGELLALL
jgi:hypothetical protein